MVNEEFEKKVERWKEKLNKIPKYKIDELNKIDLEYAKKENEEFKEYFGKGNCYICKKSLTYFDNRKPCLHYILRRTNRIKKKDIIVLLNDVGYIRSEMYLRWVAHETGSFSSINDNPDEKSKRKIIETTIISEDLEWSFSCDKSDYEGHAGKKHANFPHYHLQIRISEKPFLDYSNTHIPLTEQDMLHLKIRQGEIPEIVEKFPHGEGINNFLNLDPKILLKHARRVENESEANIHTTYILEAKPGKKISVDNYLKINEKARKEGVTLSSLSDELDANVSSITSPIGNLPDIKKRSPGRKRSKKKKV